ncbi:MAG: FliG C-terminal domain-containing protein [bacterium]
MNKSQALEFGRAFMRPASDELTALLRRRTIIEPLEVSRVGLRDLSDSEYSVFVDTKLQGCRGVNFFLFRREDALSIAKATADTGYIDPRTFRLSPLEAFGQIAFTAFGRSFRELSTILDEEIRLVRSLVRQIDFSNEMVLVSLFGKYSFVRIAYRLIAEGRPPHSADRLEIFFLQLLSSEFLKQIDEALTCDSARKSMEAANSLELLRLRREVEREAQPAEEEVDRLLGGLSDLGVQILLRDLSESEIALILAASDERTREKFYRNMMGYTISAVDKLMAELGPEAQGGGREVKRRIAKTLRQLREAGEVSE